MSIKNKVKKSLTVIIALAIIFGIVIYNFFDSREVIVKEEKGSNTLNNSEDYVVEIKGEVNRPGIYVINKKARISDVVELALGFTENADTSKINLAAKISDGMLITVLTLETQKQGKVSINSATLNQLKTIPNIGDAKAQAIIDYRNSHGKYESIEDLLLIHEYFNEGLLEKIRDFICL